MLQVWQILLCLLHNIPFLTTASAALFCLGYGWKKNKDKSDSPWFSRGSRICPYYNIWAHIRDPGPPERCRCENSQQYAGALRRGLYPPNLHPRHQTAAESSSRDDGKFYDSGHVRQKTQQKSQTGKRDFLSGTLCPSPDISACGSRCGSNSNHEAKAGRTPESGSPNLIARSRS